jgi:hypothetical protein
MTGRRLHSRSFSLVRDVDEAGQEKFLIEAEANNASQVTELDRNIVEVNEKINSATDRQVKGYSDASDNVVISASQFHEFMCALVTLI